MTRLLCLFFAALLCHIGPAAAKPTPTGARISKVPPQRPAADLFEEAYTRLQFDDVELAHQLFQAGLRSKPNDASAWMYLGDTEVRLGRVDNARRSFDKALTLSQDAALQGRIRNHALSLAPVLFEILPAEFNLSEADKAHLSENYRDRNEFSGKVYEITGTQTYYGLLPERECRNPYLVPGESFRADFIDVRTINAKISSPLYIQSEKFSIKSCHRERNDTEEYTQNMNNFYQYITRCEKEKCSTMSLERSRSESTGWPSGPGGSFTISRWTSMDGKRNESESRCKFSNELSEKICLFKSNEKVTIASLSLEHLKKIPNIWKLFVNTGIFLLNDPEKESFDTEFKGTIDGIGDTAYVKITRRKVDESSKIPLSVSKYDFKVQRIK